MYSRMLNDTSSYKLITDSYYGFIAQKSTGIASNDLLNKEYAVYLSRIQNKTRLLKI